jgi:O-antigen/teichoic acid export membrane protein
MTAVIDQLIAFTRQYLLVVLSLVGLILVAADEMLVVILKPEYAAAATAARILAIVGVFRALSYLGPPLLGGLGRPELALRYQAVAAVVLSAMFLGFAYLFGDRLGFMSVALAWAVGYPVAFAVLCVLMFTITGLSPLEYARRIAGIPACVAGACATGLAARWAAMSAAPNLGPLGRLVLIAVVMAAALALLLAKYQGITPRSILSAMKKST